MNWKQRNSLRYSKAAQMTPVQKELIEAKAGRHLIAVYPGHLWHVECEGGLLQIQCPSVNKVYGFTMKLEDIDVDLMALTRAGGEILERSRVARHKAATLDDIGSADRNLLGDIDPDLDTGRKTIKKMDLSKFEDIQFESQLRDDGNVPVTVHITETEEKPRESIIIHGR